MQFIYDFLQIFFLQNKFPFIGQSIIIWLFNHFHEVFFCYIFRSNVKYLRSGGIAYCKSNGKKYYGILTGTQIISLNKEGEPDYMELQEFLDLHDAQKLKVATQKRIAVGCHEVDTAARMSVEEENFPSTKVFVLKCLAVDNALKVDEAIEALFGSFEWLNYDIPQTITDSEEEDAQ